MNMAVGRYALAAILALSVPGSATAQSASEHASHHPNQASSGAPAAGGGGMGGMMDDMMGGPKTKAFYPSLMQLPGLSSQTRAQVEAAAHERMKSGVALMDGGLRRLSEAVASNDFVAMEDASDETREGLAQFESGVAAHRALAEGTEPRQVALDWFKRNLNVAVNAEPPAHGPFGLSTFHFLVMVLLTAFAVTMLAMYFVKMRRAAALLARLTEPGSGSGSPPPVVGTTGSASPTPPSAVATGASTAPHRWTGTLEVASIINETPNVKTFRLVDPSRAPLSFTFLPGQFLNLAVAIDGKTVRRSYTIASSPTEREWLELTIKREDQGIVSRYLHDELRVGSRFEVTVPLGSFTFTGDEADSIVLIGAGVGITPMMSAVRYLTTRAWTGDIFLLVCSRTPADIIYRKEVEALTARYANLHVVFTVSRPEGTDWSGVSGRITKELIERSVPDIRRRRVHICGPVAMMEDTKGILLELGARPELIRTENFAPAKPHPLPDVERMVPPLPKRVGSPSTPALSSTISFTRSKKTAPLLPNVSVLEVAEAIGVDMPSSCRVGTCGICITRLVAGSVTMEVDEGLDPSEKAAGFILACQAKSTGSIQVEA